MGEFFKGWRRKIGIVTLVMACVFAVGWVRSHFTDDTIIFSVGKTWLFNFESNQCGLGARAAAYGTDISTFKMMWTSHPINPSESTDPMVNVSVPVRLDGGQFHFGCKGMDLFQRRYFAICFVPYWSVVIPLTLLSAYLLLSKPRKSTPTKITEPIAARA